MKFGSADILGLAFSEGGISCAELSARGGKSSLRHVAYFEIPAGMSLDKPDALGQALAVFLRQHGFSANRAVVGVPARWLIAVEKDVPPTDVTSVKAMLRMQSERMSMGESGEMVFDYAGELQGGKAGKALLVGILKRQLDRVTNVIDAAGITVLSLTSTALALSSVGTSETDSSVLVLGRNGVEVVWRRGGAPQMLRHVALATVNGSGEIAMTSIGSELRRAVSLSAPVATNGHSAESRNLLLWDTLGLSSEQVNELSGRLGVTVQPIAAQNAMRLAGIDLADASTNGDGKVEEFAPTVALALSGTRSALLDLAHSRLAPPPVKRIKRSMVWGVVGIAAAVILVGVLYWDVYDKQNTLDTINKQIVEISGDKKDAKSSLDHLHYGAGFFDERPWMLDCYREVTMSFYDSDPIWLVSFTLRENSMGTLSGKATNKDVVIAVLGRLKSNPDFKDVKGDWSVGNGRNRDWTFTINFSYAPKGALHGPATRPTARSAARNAARSTSRPATRPTPAAMNQVDQDQTDQDIAAKEDES